LTNSPNVLQDMQERLGLTMLFVSHDLRVVRHLAHHVAVMYLGRVVDYGPAERVFAAPLHPYTQALLRAASVLQPGPRSTESALRGELPSPMQEVGGCPFHPRCPLAFDRCRGEVPRLRVKDGHGAVCHLVPEV
jgi:oligopeptide/dipeptide ABC transporter ATP-binding protein